KTIFKQEAGGKQQLDDLIAAGEVDNFIAYCKACRPILEAENGAELDSYLAMVKIDAVNPASFAPKLPRIKNYHRFKREALDQLVANEGDRSRSKPLLLILHSAFYHNGAFHRDNAAALNTLIKDTTNLAIMVEGRASLEELGGDAALLAKKYGKGGK